MRYFALAVFILHSLAELTFGASNFLSGSSSSLTPEQAEALTAPMISSYRFLGTALFSLGLLGLAIIFGPGVQSAAGRLVAGVLAIFHTMGCIGIFLTAQSNPEILSASFAIGALAIHGVLALGFISLTLTLRPQTA